MRVQPPAQSLPHRGPTLSPGLISAEGLAFPAFLSQTVTATSTPAADALAKTTETGLRTTATAKAPIPAEATALRGKLLHLSGQPETAALPKGDAPTPKTGQPLPTLPEKAHNLPALNSPEELPLFQEPATGPSTMAELTITAQDQTQGDPPERPVSLPPPPLNGAQTLPEEVPATPSDVVAPDQQQSDPTEQIIPDPAAPATSAAPLYEPPAPVAVPVAGASSPDRNAPSEKSTDRPARIAAPERARAPETGTPTSLPERPVRGLSPLAASPDRPDTPAPRTDRTPTPDAPVPTAPLPTAQFELPEQALFALQTAGPTPPAASTAPAIAAPAPFDMGRSDWPQSLVAVVSAPDPALMGEGLTLTLTPERLGTLQIRLEQQDGLTHVQILTETPEAARLLDQAQHRLADLMTRAGLEMGSQSTSSQAPQSQAQHQNQQQGQPSPEPPLPDGAPTWNDEGPNGAAPTSTSTGQDARHSAATVDLLA